MEDKARRRPKLESSTELNGKKGQKKKGVSKLVALLILVLALGALAGLYLGTDLFKPDAPTAPEDTSTGAKDTRVALLSGTPADIHKLTVTKKDGTRFTAVTESENGAAKPEEEAAVEPAAETPPAEPAMEGESAGESVPAQNSIIREVAPSQKYSIEGMPYFETDPNVMSSMFGYCAILNAQDTVADGSANLADFGLDAPEITVDTEWIDGTKHQLRFGDLAPTENLYYFQIDSDPNVYVVYTSVFKAFNRPLEEMHVTKSVTTVDPMQVQRLLIEQEGKDTVEIGYADPDADILTVNSLMLYQPIVYNANSERVQAMFDGQAAIALSGYAAHVSTDEELSAYGLNPAKAHILVRSNEVADESGNKSVTTFEIWLGNDNGGKTYARIDDSGDLYYVDTNLLGFMGNARMMYLVDQFTSLVNIVKIDALTITTPETTYSLHIEREPYVDESGKEKSNDLYYFDGALTTEDLFKDFYQILIGRLSDKACPVDGYDGKVVLSVTYDVNVEGMDDFTVEYLEYDKDYYAVRRDGHTYFLIRISSIDELLTACEQYRNGESVGND